MTERNSKTPRKASMEKKTGVGQGQKEGKESFDRKSVLVDLRCRSSGGDLCHGSVYLYYRQRQPDLDRKFG